MDGMNQMLFAKIRLTVYELGTPTKRLNVPHQEKRICEKTNTIITVSPTLLSASKGYRSHTHLSEISRKTELTHWLLRWRGLIILFYT